MVVYKITNCLNNKSYVGKSILNKEEFLASNYYGSGEIITSAVSKYGRGNFNREVIEICESIDRLNERERFWIKELKSTRPHGYNIAEGGDGGAVWINSPNRTAICEKIRKTLTGRKLSPEVIQKLRKPKSLAHRANISKYLTGRKRPDMVGNTFAVGSGGSITHPLRITRETRSCSFGCGGTFECMVNSDRGFLYNHHRRKQVCLVG